MLASPVRFLEARLLVVVFTVAAAIWGFLTLGSEVGEGETAAFDKAILFGLRQPGHPDLLRGPAWLHETARDITALGGFTVLGLVTLGAVAVLLVYARYRQAAVFGGTAVVAQVAAEVIKHAIGRPRPTIVAHYDMVSSSSFPSGHSLMAPAIYFTLAAIVAAGEIRPAARRLMILAAGLLVAAIGLSRVYLGVHWPTDVVAGWTLGSAIALVAWMLLQRRPVPASG